MESLPLFILASAVLIVTPGPDLLYVLTRGIAGGRKSGITSALGVTAGLLVHTTAAALGLAVLLKTSALGFLLVKTAGGIYLVYIGVQMIRNRKVIELPQSDQEINSTQCFVQGFISNVLNPKIALFFVTFLPQFVSIESAHQSLCMAGLGLLFALMTVVFLVLLGLCAGQIGSWLQGRKGAPVLLNSAAGTLLVGLGLLILSPAHQ